jgi:hypothetical protein
MVGNLRTPFFIIALIAAALVVLVELGSPFLIKGVKATQDTQLRLIGKSAPDSGVTAADLPKGDQPPGKAIAYMALVDGQLLFALILQALQVAKIQRLQGKVQGLIILIVGILIVLGSILLALLALGFLLIMVALFLAAPFGTVAYICKWGFFDESGAAALLSLIMLLKLCTVVMLVLAHQRFLQVKSLVLLMLTSLVCNIIIAFLHGLVPSVLVSITDMLGAIVLAILAIVWGIVMVIDGIVSVVWAIKGAVP